MLASAQIVQLKAYGDFAIAVSCLEKAVISGCSIIAGDHLRALGVALASNVGCEFVTTGDVDVPALFDARQKGLIAAASSAMAVRGALAKRQTTSSLIFDRVGLREMFVAGGSPVIQLPPAPNIYLAYEQILGHSSHGGLKVADDHRRSLSIFPASRIPAKDIPASLVARILEAADRAGIHAEVILLEGERSDLIKSGMKCRTVEKSFPSLVGATKACSVIVTADSLPAHLAEYCDIPVFVLTPKPNEYWMPRSAYQHGTWAVFDDELVGASVQSFLRRSASGCFPNLTPISTDDE